MFFETQNAIDCYGCFACVDACNFGAIKIIKKEKAYLYPEIDLMKCIGCGKCKNVLLR